MKPRDSGEPGVREKLKEISIFKKIWRFLRSWIKENLGKTWRFERTKKYLGDSKKHGDSEEIVKTCRFRRKP